MKHPNIIKLLNFYEDAMNFYFVMEYAPNNNLFNYLNLRKQFGEDEAAVFFIQTCFGLDYIH